MTVIDGESEQSKRKHVISPAAEESSLWFQPNPGM